MQVRHLPWSQTTNIKLHEIQKKRQNTPRATGVTHLANSVVNTTDYILARITYRTWRIICTGIFQKSLSMKKLIIILILLAGFSTQAQHPFHSRTKHTTVKRLKKWELRKIQSGHNLYYREGNKVYRTGRIFSGLTRPKDATKSRRNGHK